MKNIRNFCIIAHIDHGKSTLARSPCSKRPRRFRSANCRLRCWTIWTSSAKRESRSRATRSRWNMSTRARSYVLNLIDTPGMSIFLTRYPGAIASCEGALLVVDATQGIQAQTISNLYLALNHDLEIVPRHEQDRYGFGHDRRGQGSDRRPARLRSRQHSAASGKTVRESSRCSKRS